MEVAPFWAAHNTSLKFASECCRKESSDAEGQHVMEQAQRAIWLLGERRDGGDLAIVLRGQGSWS